MTLGAKELELLQRELELIKIYREQPILAARDLLGVDLAVPQQIIMEDMWSKPYVLVSAGRGCGKCITGESLVLTDKGACRIGDLGSELEPLSELEVEVYGLRGREKTSKWYYDGIQETNKIRTSYGYSIEGTDDHKVVVMSEKGSLSWRRLGDLREGDYVALERSSDIWSAENTTTLAHAYTLGLYSNSLGGGVPEEVLKSSKEVFLSYLKGLYETNGAAKETSSGAFEFSYSRTASDIQILLLNLGIVSRLEKEIDGSRSYLTVAEFDAHKFREFLDLDSGKITSPPGDKDIDYGYMDVVPHIQQTLIEMGIESSLSFGGGTSGRYTEKNNQLNLISYNNLVDIAANCPYFDLNKKKVIDIIDRNFFFDKVEEKTRGLNKVYDFVVPETHSFVANGFVNHNTFMNAVFSCLWALLWPGQKVGLLAPSFRQAKMLFAEVEKIWNIAPLLQEATNGAPRYASDRCYLPFRQAGSSPPSLIEAIPLGDGSKIRGARYYVLITDEFVQIPEEIFNTVIIPMGATVANPMENVKRIKQMDDLIRSGKATKEDFQEGSANKIIMTSSAYYQFNHMYNTLKNYEKEIAAGSTKFAVHSVSYRQMPKGFLSDDNIIAARKSLSDTQFRMEYEAIWEADSAGVFKASLVDKCRGVAPGSVLLKGDSSKQYVLGVDPARASDAFAITLIEMGLAGTPHKVVGCWEYYKQSFVQMAETLMDLCDSFNVTAVNLDSGAGGGGLALADLLADEDKFGSRRLLNVDDEDTKGLTGRRILHLFKPSPVSNAEAVYASLNLMEQSLMSFPDIPQSFKNLEELEKLEEIKETVEKMISQILLIEVSQTRSGVAHFDVPSGGGHGAQKKDLFTSFILASRKVYELTMSTEEKESILEIGLVTDWRPGASLPISSVAGALDSNMGVSSVPLNSWSYRKTFKPTK